MHWFGGTIAEAVTLSKQKNAIFVVFVEGDNDLSKELAATIEEGTVSKRLANQNNFLAIKLLSGSDNYTYFAQIYQFVPVPSLFFIGHNGTPLEVVCAGVQAINLAERIDRILEEHYKGAPQNIQPSTSGQNVKQQTTNFLQSEADANVKSAPPPEPEEQVEENAVDPDTSEPSAKIPKTVHHEVTRSGAQYEVVCDGDVCVRRPAPDGPGPSHAGAANPVETSPDDDSSEEKVERAKELIDASRREKAEKEKELEKQKEIERRATGQGVAELKRWQAEQELKQIQEDRKREKMQNNMARQRVLEQIAQDRAERRARDQPLAAPLATAGDADNAATAARGGGAGGVAGEGGAAEARVQFKLSDGGVHTAHFRAAATLHELRRHVADSLQMTPSSFSLWTAFPRRELTENDATLLDLQLVPSAALLVLPRRNANVPARPSPFASLLTLFTQFFSTIILDPSYQFYSWIRGRLFAAPPTRSPTPTPRVGPTSGPTTSPTLGPLTGPNAGIRRRGNIHRLTGDRPGDDDNNTWNGNSTQQM